MLFILATLGCTNVTLGKCRRPKPIINVQIINDVDDIATCQSYCKIIYSDRCTDFLYSVRDKTCQLYDTKTTLLDSGMCSVMGGDGGEKATDFMECLPFFDYKSNSCAVSTI